MHALLPQGRRMTENLPLVRLLLQSFFNGS